MTKETITWSSLEFYAPSLSGQSLDKTRILGDCLYIWMHSKKHNALPLARIKAQLVPAIEKSQFLVAFTKQNKPVALAIWAYFDPEREVEYIKHGRRMVCETSLACGNRAWMIYVIAPFGHYLQIHSFFKKELFVKQPLRYLYQKNKEHPPRVALWHGRKLGTAQALKWHEKNPLWVDAPLLLPKV